MSERRKEENEREGYERVTETGKKDKRLKKEKIIQGRR